MWDGPLLQRASAGCPADPCPRVSVALKGPFPQRDRVRARRVCGTEETPLRRASGSSTWPGSSLPRAARADGPTPGWCWAAVEGLWIPGLPLASVLGGRTWAGIRAGIRAVLGGSPGPDGCPARSPRHFKGRKTRQWSCVVNSLPAAGKSEKSVMVARKEAACVVPLPPVASCDSIGRLLWRRRPCTPTALMYSQCCVRVPSLTAATSVKRPVLRSLARTAVAQRPALLVTGWAWKVTRSPDCRAPAPRGAGHRCPQKRRLLEPCLFERCVDGPGPAPDDVEACGN